MMRKITVLVKRHPLFILSVIFFAVRLYHLTAIPIFNDEAIYLDWGWREVHSPNNLFYSLYAAKPPLLMWLFGIAAAVIPSILVAGRFVGVVFGYITLLGIWTLAKKVSSGKSAMIASFLYIAIPIFSFFDRQALMESAIGAVSVWACFATLKLMETNADRWAVFLGCILGVGIFIKPNAALFFIPAILILGIHYVKKRNVFRFLSHTLLLSSVALFVLSPMLIQSMFWQTIRMNTLYVSSVSLSKILLHFIQAIEVLIVHLTPMPVVVFIVSVILLLSSRPKKLIDVGIWFFISFIIGILLLQHVIERYIVSFLPITTVLIAFALSQITRKIYQHIVISVTVGTAFIVTFLQILSPLAYFSLLSRFSHFSLGEYTKGYTSGYGISEAVGFLQERIGENPAFIAIAIHTGNPESAVTVSFMKQKNVLVSYLEASYIKDIDTYDCLSSLVPIYFVSREEDTAGLDRFFDRIYFKRNTVSGFGIGIYTVKKSCAGKTLPLRWDPT